MMGGDFVAAGGCWRRALGVAVCVVMLCRHGVVMGEEAAAATAPAPATAPAWDSVAASAEVSRAIGNLTSPEYADRQAASAELQSALARQFAALLLPEDAEAASRGRRAVRIATATGTWALGVLSTFDGALSREVLSFALSPQVAPLLPDVMGEDVARQHEALAKIAAMGDARVGDFFAAVITTADARRAAVAIDVAYDVKPSEALLKVLWGRVVHAFGASPIGGPAQLAGFQGKHVTLQQQYVSRFPDQTFLFAGDLLITWKDPRTGETFRRYVARMAKIDGESGETGLGFGGGFGRFNQGESMRVFTAFAKAFKVREVIPYVAKLATGNRTYKNGGQMNNRAVITTNRTQMLGLLVTLTEQDAKDYFLSSYMWNPGDGVWCTDTEAHESAAVEKAKGWWDKHQSEYGVAATSAPATTSPSGKSP